MDVSNSIPTISAASPPHRKNSVHLVSMERRQSLTSAVYSSQRQARRDSPNCLYLPEFHRRHRSYSLQGHSKPRTAVRAICQEPSYKLSPDSKPPLQAISNTIERVLRDAIGDIEYSGIEANQWVKAISERLKSETKQLLPPNSRYKVISMVHITQKSGQSVKVSSRCLWEPEYDLHVTGSYENKSVIAVATIFCVYTN